MCSIAWTAARFDRGLVDRGDVPEREVRGPERERHERVRENAQPHDSGECQDRAEQRAGQAGKQAERREVAEQEVLGHVEREELLLADCSER